MEALLNFFLELFVEGSAEIARSNRSSRLLRYLVLVFMIGAICILFFLAYSLRFDLTYLWTFFLLGSFIGIFLLKLAYEYLKRNNVNNEEYICHLK